MDKEFLFLFPYEKYFLHMGHQPYHPQAPRLFADMIDARYRSQGYGVSFALFPVRDDDPRPDLSDAQMQLMLPQDRTLTTDASYATLQTWHYPDWKKLLDQLPVHERLVVAGFHFGDCADTVAQLSHARGIDTFLDQDLTDWGLACLALRQPPPLVREHWTLREVHKHTDEWLLEHHILPQHRDRPWRVQEF